MSNVSDLLDSVPKGLWLGGKLVPAEKTGKNYVSGRLAKLGIQRRIQAAVFGAKVRKPQA